MSISLERGSLISLGGLLGGGGLGLDIPAIPVLVASSGWSLYQYRRTTHE